MMIFCDSFEQVDSAGLHAKWRQSQGDSFITTDIVRTGARSARGDLRRAFALAHRHRTIITGVALYPISTIVANGYRQTFLANNGAHAHVHANVLANGAIAVYRGIDTAPSNIIAQTDANLLVANNWQYIELSVTLSTAAVVNGSPVFLSDGAVVVRVNNVVVASAANVRTWAGDSIGAIEAGTYALLDATHFFATNNYRFDDLYICNGAGSANNTFLGDVRVTTIKPNGAGSRTDFTPVGNPDNYNNVNAIPQQLTNYNVSNVPGAVDLYAMEDLALPSDADIIAIQTALYAAKGDSGPLGIAPMIRRGGTDYEGVNHSLSQVAGGVAGYHLDVYESDPSTAARWTTAGVNAMELGAKVKSS